VQLRFFHASPTSERVTVLAGDLTLGEASYGELVPQQTALIPADSESVMISILPTGEEMAEAVTELEITREHATEPQLIVFAGDASSRRVNEMAQLYLVEDRVGEAGASGSRVRWVNATWGLPDITIDIGRDDPTNPEIRYWPRFSATPVEGYEMVTAGPHRMGIVTTFSRYLRGFTLPELEDDARLFAVVAGDHTADVRSASGLRLFVVGPDSVEERRGDPEVFFLNAITFTGSARVDIDAYIEEQLRFPGQMFGLFNNNQVSRHIASLSMERIALHAKDADPGASSPLLEGMMGPLEPGGRYLVVAAGHLTEAGTVLSGSILTVEHDLPMRDDTSEDTSMRFVHAAPLLPERIDFGYRMGANMRADGELFSNLGYGEVSPGGGATITTSESATLAITSAGSGVAEFPLRSYPIRVSSRYLAVLVGGPADSFATAYRVVLVQPWTEALFGSQDPSNFFATNIGAER